MNTPELLTGDVPGNSQLLYFTSPSLTADDRYLTFIGDGDGDPNLYRMDLESGEVAPLTENRHGYQKSYVYFDGRHREGLGKASVSLDPTSGFVYYLMGGQIRVTEPGGETRVLNEIPVGQVTAFTHVSADGRRLCVPTTDSRALDAPEFPNNRPPYDIDARVQAEGLSSFLCVYDTETGAEIVREEVPRAWVTHVQFSPADPGIILYNHEWPADCGIRRMWLFDGQEHRRLRTEGPGRSRADWTCHEMWTRDGSAILYHGKYADGPSYLGRVLPTGEGLAEVALPEGFTRYGHFTVGPDERFVSDGYYREPSDGDVPGSGGQWISLQRVDWSASEIEWTPLCRHGSSWDSQDSHPHPVFDHGGKYVYFTSDAHGRRGVWRVAAGG